MPGVAFINCDNCVLCAALCLSTPQDLVHALITTRVNYCNSVLYGITTTNLRPLQSVINVAARLITGNCKFDHITDTLHWLPVRQRIQFKLCSLVSNCQRRTAPSYLANMCIPVSATSGHTHLPSAVHCDLVVPRTRLAHYGPCSFAISVPVTWNSLPPDCRETSVSAASFFSQLNRGVNLGGREGHGPSTEFGVERISFFGHVV